VDVAVREHDGFTLRDLGGLARLQRDPEAALDREVHEDEPLGARREDVRERRGVGRDKRPRSRELATQEHGAREADAPEDLAENSLRIR
jgi:hypothetical protein